MTFGINIAPEIFQLKMNELLEGLEYMAVDGVIVHRKDMATHDRDLKNTLERMEQEGLSV